MPEGYQGLASGSRETSSITVQNPSAIPQAPVLAELLNRISAGELRRPLLPGLSFSIDPKPLLS